MTTSLTEMPKAGYGAALWRGLKSFALLRESWDADGNRRIDGTRWETTNQIGSDHTVGSSSDCADIILGSWKWLTVAHAGNVFRGLVRTHHGGVFIPGLAVDAAHDVDAELQAL